MPRTITKVDLVSKVADITLEDPNVIKKVMLGVLECLSNEMAAGNRIELRGFGVFKTRVRKAKIGRNPKKPKNTVEIPSYSVPAFKPGKILRARVKAAINKVKGKNAKS